MIGYNYVVMVGELQEDPVLTYAKNGNEMVLFPLCCKERSRGRTLCTFIDVKCFSKLAKAAAKYLKKGSPVLIEGKIYQGRWVDRNKKVHIMYNVNAFGIRFLGDAKDYKQLDDGKEVPEGQPF